MLHADQRYYDPIGLPLPSKRSGVGSRRETACGDSFPATPPQTGHEVLPHPAFPRAVERPHSAVPLRWRTLQATAIRHGPGHQRWTGEWHHSKPAALPIVSHTRLQALRSGGFCCSAVHHYYDLLRLPLGAPPLHSPAAYRLRRYRQSRCGTTQPPHRGYSGAETDLSCSAMHCATIPPSLPRWVHRRCALQALRAVHGLRPVKRGSAPTLSPLRGCKVPHRTDWLLARRPKRLCHDASTVGSPLPPATSYRAAWSLPGPDSHRQAHRSLAGHTFTIGLYPWSLPDEGQADGSLLFRTRLCARAATHTPEGPDELTPDQGSPDMAFAVK